MWPPGGGNDLPKIVLLAIRLQVALWRLTETEQKAIKAAVKKHFDATARVYLFGSKTAEQKRGGDIDLYIETELRGEELLLAKLRTMSEIQRRIGDRKIDIVTAQAEQTKDIPPVVQNAWGNRIPL